MSCFVDAPRRRISCSLANAFNASIVQFLSTFTSTFVLLRLRFAGGAADLLLERRETDEAAFFADEVERERETDLACDWDFVADGARGAGVSTGVLVCLAGVALFAAAFDEDFLAGVGALSVAGFSSPKSATISDSRVARFSFAGSSASGTSSGRSNKQPKKQQPSGVTNFS